MDKKYKVVTGIVELQFVVDAEVDLADADVDAELGKLLSGQDHVWKAHLVGEPLVSSMTSESAWQEEVPELGWAGEDVETYDEVEEWE